MKVIQSVVFIFFCSIFSVLAMEPPHCEIPCGIYSDSLQVQLLQEHIKTIEKSMTEINVHSNEAHLDYNQIVRWVSNKETHAEKVQFIMTQYFMFQRVKPSTDSIIQARNNKLLNAIHKLCVLAMKAKQSTDPKITQAMIQELSRFEHLYFSGK